MRSVSRQAASAHTVQPPPARTSSDAARMSTHRLPGHALHHIGKQRTSFSTPVKKIRHIEACTNAAPTRALPVGHRPPATSLHHANVAPPPRLCCTVAVCTGTDSVASQRLPDLVTFCKSLSSFVLQFLRFWLIFLLLSHDLVLSVPITFPRREWMASWHDPSQVVLVPPC
jgi:hypothetical protein